VQMIDGLFQQCTAGQGKNTDKLGALASQLARPSAECCLLVLSDANSEARPRFREKDPG
jgi:hypothetical protein